MMKARAYYSKLARETGVASSALERKISVRVRVDHVYNLVTHFAEIEDYNNSRYIPSNFRGKWGSEIWFDKLKSGIERVDWYNLTMCAAGYLKGSEWKALAIVAPLEIFKHYNAGIDGAKLPDVIYHEAFHWASDVEGLFPMAAEGNPVSEDYANYFASSLNGRPLIAEIDEFTSRYYKRSFEEVKDIKGTSSMKYNSMTFGPSIFWQIRNLLGQDRADRLLWRSMRELKGSYKHGDVPTAVLTAASNDRSITQDEFSQIRALFEAHLRSYARLQLKFNPLEPVTDQKSLLPASQSAQQPSSPTLQQAESSNAASATTVADTTSSTPQASQTPSENEQSSSQSSASANPILAGVSNAFEAAGNWIVAAGTKTLQFAGYVGNGVSSLLGTPMSFGADLVTGAVYGKGMISDHESDTAPQIVGAVGGLGMREGVYSIFSSHVMSVLNPASLVGLGTSIATSLTCYDVDPEDNPETAHYCKRATFISNKITLTSAQAGARMGKSIHSFFVDAIDGIKKIF